MFLAVRKVRKRQPIELETSNIARVKAGFLIHYHAVLEPVLANFACRQVVALELLLSLQEAEILDLATACRVAEPNV